MNTKTAILAVIGLLVIVAIALVVVFKVSPSKIDSELLDQTNWKTFETPDTRNIGISFKYPETWTVGSWGGTKVETLDNAIEEHTQSTAFKRFYENTNFEIRDISLSHGSGKIIMPSLIHTVDFSSTKNIAYLGVLFVELPVPSINPVTEERTGFYYFNFTSLLDRDAKALKPVTLDTWQQIANTMEFVELATLAELQEELGLCSNDTQPNGEIPKFEDYPVTEIFEGPYIYPDPEEGTIEKIQQAIKDAIAQGEPDFAGHYLSASWSCGSNCPLSGFIDLKTGILQQVGGALEFRLDSSLFIDDQTYVGIPSQEKVTRRFYNMNNGEAEFICSEIVDNPYFIES